MTMEIDATFKLICSGVLLVSAAVLFLGGIFTLVCTLFKLKFFVRHPKYAVMEKVNGVAKTRTLYLRLGGLCLAFGAGGTVVAGLIIGKMSDTIMFILVGILVLWILGEAGRWAMGMCRFPDNKQ